CGEARHSDMLGIAAAHGAEPVLSQLLDAGSAILAAGRRLQLRKPCGDGGIPLATRETRCKQSAPGSARPATPAFVGAGPEHDVGKAQVVWLQSPRRSQAARLGRRSPYHRLLVS